MGVIQYIVNLGASVMMPVIFFILALAVGVKAGKAFKAALLVGIGFEGLTMVINLLLDNLGPAATAMVDRLGVDLNILDTGWPVAATVGWGSPLMVAGVFIFIAINIVMIGLKLTNTVDIDIFNYWIFLCEGALIYEITQNAILSLAIMGVLFAFMLKLADWTAEKIQKEFQVEGISFPHLNSAPYMVFAVIIDYIFDKIPGLNKIQLNPETINSKFGLLGDSTTIGVILGAVIGILAGYDVGATVTLAVKVAAAMVLLPKMVDILMEGLNIVRKAVEEKLAVIFPGRKFYIGMDVALLVANPSVLAVGLLLIPITLFLAIILPGNKVLPFVDLPSLIFAVTVVSAYCKKDMFRMLAAGTCMMVFTLYAATDLAAVYSQAAHTAHAAFPEGMNVMSALNGGFANPLGWIIVKIIQMLHLLG